MNHWLIVYLPLILKSVECTECPGTIQFLDSQNVRQFEGCEHVQGNLIINTNSTGSGAVSSTDLFLLRNIREIDGYLKIEGMDNPQVTDLRFLRRLEVIRGNETMPIFRRPYSLVIQSNIHLRTLSLASLRQIQNGGVWVANNQQLCLADTIHFQDIFSGNARRTVTQNNLECSVQGVHCSEECVQGSGCWGTLPDECVMCRNYQYRDTCVSTCNTSVSVTDESSNQCLPLDTATFFTEEPMSTSGSDFQTTADTVSTSTDTMDSTMFPTTTDPTTTSTELPTSNTDTPIDATPLDPSTDTTNPFTATSGPSTDATTSDPSNDATNPSTDTTTSDPSTDATDPSTNITTSEPSNDAINPSADITTSDPSTDATDPSTDDTTSDPSTDVTTSDPSTDITTSDPSADVTTFDPSTDVTTSDPLIDATDPSTGITTSHPSTTMIPADPTTATFGTTPPSTPETSGPLNTDLNTTVSATTALDTAHTTSISEDAPLSTVDPDGATASASTTKDIPPNTANPDSTTPPHLVTPTKDVPPSTATIEDIPPNTAEPEITTEPDLVSTTKRVPPSTATTKDIPPIIAKPDTTTTTSPILSTAATRDSMTITVTLSLAGGVIFLSLLCPIVLVCLYLQWRQKPLISVVHIYKNKSFMPA